MALRLHAITLADGAHAELPRDGRQTGMFAVVRDDIQFIPFRDLCAVVSEQKTFSLDEATPAEVERHRQIVDGIFRRTTVLPAPFAAAQGDAHLIRALRERLRDAESELGSANAILALHPEPILVIDAGRAILRGNAAARTLFHGDADGRGAGAVLDHKEVV